MARFWIYTAFALAILALVAGAADVSTRTSTCMSCHPKQAAFAHWMSDKLVAEKKGFSHELISCAACHMDGAAQGTVMSRFRGLLHAITYVVPTIDPREPLVTRIYKTTHISSENCKYCHQAAIVRKTVWKKDLPGGDLKVIGLAMDHRKHLVTSEDTCARCHERYANEPKGKANKEVNYAEVNHLSCDACHTAASHAYQTGRILPIPDSNLKKAWETTWDKLSKNPRWMIALPTEETCRRCHNGKIHFKTRIFLADCSNGKNYDECVKCHPTMTRNWFREYRKKRESVKTASKRNTQG